ncbi:PP2C family serine/threonine-protein phosphatase [Cellulomonas sp. PhB143]|uniref:PP2C family protein-serine/threonine phosphatase n=1 Tax=Cellulomonas sp. PhB143 TaxID=2485186 RepID=UPI000F49530B|nr:PP2C family serine/threonine-protein phosphatase [Cellulomonas sp. PhB143]ROS75576.1 protein phosphatase [Cellulomonas sp. PhB143]
MDIALRYAARSDVGLVRSNNQDSAYAGTHLLAVADGMGGHAGGDVASSLTIAALAGLDGESTGPDQALAALERAVDHAREDLVRRTQVDHDLTGMGTTVTAMVRTGSTLVMAHLGDSRAYLLRDGELTQVTTDHTFVQHLVDTGRITAEEAEVHPQRNVVMRVLGDFDVDLTPDLSVREALVGDRWLLCSDGLSGFVGADTLAETLRSVPDVDACADKLLQLALRAGSTDNITAIVAEVVDLDAPSDAAPDTVPQVVGSAATDRWRTEALNGTTGTSGSLGADTAPVPDDGTSAAQAAAPEPAAGDPDDPDPAALDAEDLDEDARELPRRRPWIPVLGVVVILAVLVGGAWAAYLWTQTRYFVGVADGNVAVYQGVPSTIGPIELSTPVDVTGTPVSELPLYLQQRLEQTIPETSQAAAQERADAIAQDAVPPVPEPTPTPGPTAPTPTPTPTAARVTG